MKLRVVRRNDEDVRLMADLNRLAGGTDDGAGPIDLPERAGAEAPPDREERPGRVATFLAALTRSNDDPQLLADLDRLAGSGDGVEPASDPGRRAAKDPVRAALLEHEETAELVDDGFVVGLVRTARHVRRYLPFYAVSAAWLAVMLFVSPLSGPKQNAELAGSLDRGGRSAATDPVEEVVSAGSVDEAVDASYDTDFSTGSLFPAFSAADSEPYVPPTTSDAEVATPRSTTPTTSPASPAPKPLSIFDSGYASQAGGTPVEQQPANGGLPVHVTGGNATKFSFLRLVGTESILRLQEVSDPGANVNATMAELKMCPIESGPWSPQRGVAMSQAPKYGSACSTGTRAANGQWTFDLSNQQPARADGFAIVPTNNPALNFQVVFKPIAVTG